MKNTGYYWIAGPVTLGMAGCLMLETALAAPTPRILSPVGVITQVESRQSESERLDTTSAEYVIVKKITSRTLPPDAAGVFFVLREIKVEGSSVLSHQEISKLIAPSLGKRMSLADFLAIGEKIKQAYYDAGYKIPEVIAPPQRIAGGIAGLEIKEYFFDRVVFFIDGRQETPPADLLALADLITKTRPLTREVYARAIDELFKERSDFYVIDAREITDENEHEVVEIELTRDFSKRPPPGSLVIPPRLDLSAPPPNAERFRINLKDVVVKGVTVYDQDYIRSLFAPMLGRETTLVEFFKAIDTLKKRYNDDDYAGVRISVPGQISTNGVVEVFVKEYSINEMTVTLNGDILGPESMVQRVADRARLSRPLRNADVERYMSLMRDIPGTRVSGYTQPEGPDGPLYIAAERSRTFSGSFSVDNRGTQPVGPYQGNLDLSFYSPFGFDDKLTLGANFSAQTQEMLSFSLKDEVMLHPEGLMAYLIASHTEIEQGAKLAPLYVQTYGDKLGLRLRYPFIRSQGFSWYGFGQILFSNEHTTGLKGAVTVTDDRLRTIRLGTTLDFKDPLLSRNRIDFELNFGIDGLGAQVSGESTQSYRPGLEPDYSKLVLNLSREQPLSEALALNLDLSAQYGFTRIPSAQLAAYGGTKYGRGYLGAIIYGDSSVMASTELLYTKEIDNPILNGIQPYAYYDFGRTWIRDPQGVGLENGNMYAASFGLGIRANLLQYVTADLSFNQALVTDYVDSGGRMTRDPLYLFSVEVNF
jgi:hemolysin activation/secretion protein